MRHWKAALAVIAALLVAAMSVSAFARGHGGGRGSGGGHTPFHGASPGNHPGHGSSRVHGPAGHVGGQRPFVRGGARVGVFIGAPLYAPFFYPAPSYYYSPAPVYIEQAPTPAYWYFCPDSNAYYPYVQECPGGWQPVLPQPSG